MTKQNTSTALGIILIILVATMAPPSLSDLTSQLFSSSNTWQRIGTNVMVVYGSIALTIIMLICAACSNKFIKWLFFIVIGSSIAFTVTYYYATHKSMFYGDWLIMWNAQAAAGGAISEFKNELIKSLSWVSILFIAFLLIKLKNKIAPFVATISFLLLIYITSTTLAVFSSINLAG